ncbi:Ig-like domain-containing protein [Croceivirga sp. JEA036]|uniref:Ig-like domain-containing protein n=1 Tax=Croceivirga sp. JEA036 TaxID=2721162 RepID=UPI001438A566|nr:Ig-like domain-containing protein [Croceivirga sp. JEA036]NJB36876.1 Ig-like domain-containing protein [Croceivirga sp. JEA036]
MKLLKKLLSLTFLLLSVITLWQCARRGSPSGGPKDISAPVLEKATPPNLTKNFKGKKIKLEFDEYIKLKDLQDQLIISPPLKYQPEITPQGSASKSIEIVFKDTLRENTTYTINFGQSIVDHNEGNPYNLFTYVFSTGDVIDSLTLSGAVKDAFKRKADEFISVMLYEIDTAYNDSTIYKYPPNYMTNTLDSLPIFKLSYLKAGQYKLFGLKDAGKNNVFDQRADKIAFLEDTITLPTDSIYLLSLFKEVPDFTAAVPSYVAKNKIIFGYSGAGDSTQITPLTILPDSVKTIVKKEKDKDTLNYWITPTDLDSIVFSVTNNQWKTKDTFTVKTRKLALDSLKISPSHSSRINFREQFKYTATTPLTNIDSSYFQVLNIDSTQVSISPILDTINNEVALNFELLDNQKYYITALPGAMTDFFGQANDSIKTTLTTGSLADYGDLTFNLAGNVTFPVIVQLTDTKDELVREITLTEFTPIDFGQLLPGEYRVRVIFDANENGKWDTGNFLKGKQPEKIIYYPDVMDIRAFSEYENTFTIAE